MDIDLNIKPIYGSGLTHNVLRISVSYDKRAKGPVARLQAAQVDPPVCGFVGFRVALFGSPSETVNLFTPEQAWKTNNKKKLEAVFAEVEAGIAAKSSDLYAGVLAFLAKHNSEIVAERFVTSPT